ncbi:hypothetical protein HC031_10115 [Planosporangium thailandense]|uniref:Uncharacterized protein n=1 Tax=Planosporangium thailandense TaxID=765197 RepID=A0ABX0XW49_9ACTN|nr:hypothetical protein [Planosporangium thailandense]NJC70061.1 hypothetical protein [Planosporangium thailandense]
MLWDSFLDRSRSEALQLSTCEIHMFRRRVLPLGRREILGVPGLFSPCSRLEFGPLVA